MKSTRATDLATIAIGVVLSVGCCREPYCSQNLPEATQAPQNGQVVATSAQPCAGELLSNLLCGGSCPTNELPENDPTAEGISMVCTEGGKSRTELFTGIELTSSSRPAACWNGFGGNGRQLSDSALCAFRDLANSSKRSKAWLSLGRVGKFQVIQQLSFKDFNPAERRFRGYRSVAIAIPGIGTQQIFDAPFTLQGDALDCAERNVCADRIPIISGSLIDTTSDGEGELRLRVAKGFPVATPIGNIKAIFRLGADRSVSSSFPSVGSAPLRILNGTNMAEAVPMRDILGSDPGMRHVIEQRREQANRIGWSSQVGLGTRGPTLWSDQEARDDFRMSMARTEEEGVPTFATSIGVALKYPDPEQLGTALDKLGVPESIRSALGGSKIYVFVDLSSEFRSWSQSMLYFDEGTTVSEGEWAPSSNPKIPSIDVASGVRFSQMKADLLTHGQLDFRFKVGARIKISAFGFDIVDMTPTYQIPIGNLEFSRDASPSTYALALDRQPDQRTVPPQLDLLRVWSETPVPNYDAFISECFSATPPPSQDPPKLELDPDDPNGCGYESNPACLIERMGQPCNVCVAWEATESGENSIPSFSGFLSESATKPGWACTPKSVGCMNLCRANGSGEFEVTSPKPMCPRPTDKP